MQHSELNPFHDLYVTELVGAKPGEYVKLFSPLLVKNALLLFERTNVVLKGTQGSGKSMLLNLLKPEMRVAYHHAGEDFPVPERLRRFVGAGINLTRCGILDIGQRPIKGAEEDMRVFPLCFADFLNSWVVRDILRSVNVMRRNPKVFEGIVTTEDLDEFARELASQDCWFGYLSDVSDCDALDKRLHERIMAYRRYHQFNTNEIPQEIWATKTAIGEPIARAAECLSSTGVLPKDVPILVRIDQHELLCRSDDLRHDLGVEYRRMINKALSTRDPRVHYRIGTRGYAWSDDLTVYGTTSPLEWERDYKVIDMDELLRREENKRLPWLFPKFAKDVFGRRLERANLTREAGEDDDILKAIMGPSPSPGELARIYVGTSSSDRALRIDDNWPEEWKSLLRALYEDDPLVAKLAEAWMLQGSKTKRRIDQTPPADAPWSKKYWRKERVRQALLQLAASCGQKLLWWGEESILSLSMGSILVFVSLCQHIWDTFFRFERMRPMEDRQDPLRDGIRPEVQSIAIQTASKRWCEKIAVEEAGGTDRQKFINRLGEIFQTTLYQDKALSYPGHNGFSLARDECEQHPGVREFLSDAVDYGDLYEVSHTTKERDRRQRIKWYLHPILSPHFRLPESHIKEPMYVSVAHVVSWIEGAQVLLRPRGTRERVEDATTKEGQLRLFEKQ